MPPRFALRSLVPLLSAFFVAPRLHGQSPQVQYLYPSEAAIGGTVEAEWIGKQVDRIERAYFSRPGIEAKQLGKGKVALSVAPKAAPGDCDAWAVSTAGSAMPVRLTIGAFPSRTETEPNNGPAQAQEIALPATVGGRIDPGTDTDWYRVRLQAGDGLTLACRSATLGGTLQPTLVVLDPQGREIAHDTLTQSEPVVHLEAAEAGDYTIGVQERSYRATPSPFYQLSLTTGPWIVGAYPPTVEKGKTSRVTLYGYRLPAGEPAADAQGPLRQQTVELAVPESPRAADRGWVLSRSIFVDSFEYRLSGAGGSVRFEILDRPVPDASTEAAGAKPTSANSTSAGSVDAVRREIPFDVVNRFASPRDVVHWYRFTAQAGRTYWLEAVAERIDRACDLELIVHDAAGKPLETIGNFTTPKEVGTALPLDSRDPAGNWKAPADGDYLLAVRDLLAAQTPSVRRAYRVSVGPRREDVRVAAMLGDGAAPPGWTVRAGGKLTVKLVVVRRGGHQAPIEVRAEELPPGLTIAPLTIPADQSTGTLSIAAATGAVPWIGPIRLTATTQADRRLLTTPVRPAAPLASAAPAISRFCDEMVITVVGSAAK